MKNCKLLTNMRPILHIGISLAKHPCKRIEWDALKLGTLDDQEDGTLTTLKRLLDIQFELTSLHPKSESPQDAEKDVSTVQDPILSRLENVEKNRTEQTNIVSQLLSTNDEIFEKLSHIEKQLAGLQKDVQLVEVSMEKLKESKEGPEFEETEKRLLEDFEQLDWYEAKAKCKSLNASLLSLQNGEEWNAITPHLNRYRSYWLDIIDIRSEGEYISETSGQKTPFFKWIFSEPNNPAFSINNEDCVELRSEYNHYMNDINCFAKNYYICKANLNITLV